MHCAVAPDGSLVSLVLVVPLDSDDDAYEPS